MNRIPIYYRVTLIYAFFGILWIFFSDQALEALAENAATLSFLQTLKGWFYVAITSALLFVLIRLDYRALEAKEREKERVFAAMLFATHHILNNFLNKMLLFRLEAERSRDFQEETLRLYDRVIDEARGEIARLSEVQELSEEKIRASILPR